MVISFVVDALRGLAAVGLAAGVAWSSHVGAAVALGRDARTSARLAAAAVLGAWYQVVVFWLLVPFGAFRLTVVLLVVAVTVLALARWPRAEGARTLWLDDLRQLVRFARSMLRGPAGWLAAPVFGRAAVQWLRGSAAPPLGWDALTYHLYKAGRWVQHGAMVPMAAPDAWSYYEYFPVVGDIFNAWAMLPLRSDALITTVGVAIWSGIVLGVYAAARELGARPDRSLLAGLAVASLPSALPFLSSAYVDNTVASLFALGSVFVIRAWRRRSLADAPVAAAALGLMVGTKPTSVGLFALGAVVAIVGIVRYRASARARRLAFFACVLAAIAGYPGYQRAWIEQGSPFHPFVVSIGDFVVSRGVEATTAVADDLASNPDSQFDSPWEFWLHFLSLPVGRRAFLNPGIGSVLIVLLGLFGLVRLLRRRGRRVEALYLLGCALFMVLFFLSGGMEPFRHTLWMLNSGRYVVAGFVAMAILGAVADEASAEGGAARRWGAIAWVATIASSLFSLSVRGIVAEEIPADLRVLGIAVAAVTIFWLLAYLGARRPGIGRAATSGLVAAAVLVAAIGLAAVQAVRDQYRYVIYRASVDVVSPVFHMHALAAPYAAAWPIWEALDAPSRRLPGGEGWRIAVTAGYDGLGHNWYWYPLLGSRLQNEVFYVPVTADGSIFDYRNLREEASRASFPAWLARLDADRVDYVVSLAPRLVIEDYWMDETPQLFHPEVEVPGPDILAPGEPMKMRNDYHAAYRFDRAALSEGAERRP